METLLFIVVIFLFAIALLLAVANVLKSRKNRIPPTPPGEKKWILVVGVVILIAALGLWGLSGTIGTSSIKSPSLKTVVEVTQSYWLWLLLVGCIAYVLLSFIPKGKGDLVKKSKTILTAFGLLLVGALVWSWVARGGDGRRQSEKMTLVIPANGDSAHVSPPAGYSPAFTGYGFMSHCVYSDGTDLEYPCAPTGPIVYYYVHDNTGRANLVTYEFVRP